jgi:ferredoxin
LGFEFDATGRLGVAVLKELGVPRDADFYLCGPSAFLDDLSAGLAAWGVAASRVHKEIFGPGESLTPGISAEPARPVHAPVGAVGQGPQVSFARSGLTVRWDAKYQNLLELAEACDVPVRWSCRTGVCHNCESGLISGAVSYRPEPLDEPAAGDLLICCSQPQEDIVIDL